MNIEYVVNKKKASISNEKGELKVREYTLHFEEILEKENEIELIENQLKYVKKEIENFCKMQENQTNRYEKIYSIALLILDFTLIPLICLKTVPLWALLKILVLCGLEVITFLPTLKIINHLSSKTYKNDIERNEFQIPFLEKDLNRAKQELNNFQERNIPIKNIDKPKVMHVQGKEKLQSQKKYFEYLKRYGAQIKHQANIYAQGLWEELEEKKIAYSGIDTELFANYLNEYNTRKLMKRNKVS